MTISYVRDEHKLKSTPAEPRTVQLSGNCALRPPGHGVFKPAKANFLTLEWGRVEAALLKPAPIPKIIWRRPAFAARQAKRPPVMRAGRPTRTGPPGEGDPDGEPPRPSHLRLVDNGQPGRTLRSKVLVMVISAAGEAGPFCLPEESFHELCRFARGLESSEVAI